MNISFTQDLFIIIYKTDIPPKFYYKLQQQPINESTVDDLSWKFDYTRNPQIYLWD